MLIVGVVIIPLAIAWVMYFYFPQLAPSGTTNEGVFISPPVLIEELAVENLETGQWTMIFVGDGSCDEECKTMFYMGRQVHTAMGKDRSRIKRIYLSTRSDLSIDFAQFLKSDHPSLENYKVDERDLEAGMGRVFQGKILQESAPEILPLHRYLFLMDPLGNIIMYYVPEKVGKPLQKDLKTLLKLSNIG